MQGNCFCGAAALAAMIYCAFVSDADAQHLPAVSAPNGKIAFDAGALTLPHPSFMGRAAGTLTLPLGERFGVQADLTAATAPGFTTSGAVHVFTRDPASYLIGGTLGFVRSPGAWVVAAGPEGELYLDRWTLEAWAGLAMARPIAPGPAPARTRPFVFANLHYYATDNWRLSAGVSSLDGYNALELGSEYLFEGPGIPVALTGEARFGQDGGIRAMVGLRGYFGPDPHKSLIGRHREDDPADRSTALYIAAGTHTLSGTPAAHGAGGSGGGGSGDGDGSEPYYEQPAWCYGQVWYFDTGICETFGGERIDPP